MIDNLKVINGVAEMRHQIIKTNLNFTTMKRIKLMAAAAIMAVVATAGYMGYAAYEYATMTDQERLFKANLDALSWSENYGPGEDRKQMAIQCGIGGWNIKAGCCLGYSYCSFTECTEPLINGCEPW